MILGPSTFYIVAAYGLTGLVFCAFIAWVVFDYRRQYRIVRALEAEAERKRKESVRRKENSV
jgi:heme exporter protein CcmD